MTAAPRTTRTAPPTTALTIPPTDPSPARTGHPDRPPAGEPAAAPGGARLPDLGHMHARFGGIPVLVTAEMAAQIKAFRQGSRDDQPVPALRALERPRRQQHVA
jgi:hypothetical protein